MMTAVIIMMDLSAASKISSFGSSISCTWLATFKHSIWTKLTEFSSDNQRQFPLPINALDQTVRGSDVAQVGGGVRRNTLADKAVGAAVHADAFLKHFL